MSPLALAWRSTSRAPARAVLGIAGIAAVGALLFDMLLLSRGLLVSFRDLLESIGFDVRVVATEALPTMGPSIRDASAICADLRRLPEIAQVVRVRSGTAVAMRSDGTSTEIGFLGSDVQSEGRRSWTMVRGASLDGSSRPDGVPSVLVNRALAEDLALEPGSRVLLRAGWRGGTSALPAVSFRVVGIASFAFESAGGRTAMTDIDAHRRTLGAAASEDAADLLLVASRPEAGADAAVAAIERARPELHAFSNEQFLARFSREDFSYFRQISLVLTSITLFFAFLLVTTLLTVAINQRLGEVAALRAIGFSRVRVAADLMAESALLVATGAAISIPLGLLLALLLDSILRELPGLPEKLHFFVLEPRAVLLQVALLGLAGFLAALYPVLVAVRLPIAATLRKEVVS